VDLRSVLFYLFAPVTTPPAHSETVLLLHPNRRTLLPALLAVLTLPPATVRAGLIRFASSASSLGLTHRWGNDTLDGDLGGGVALDDFDHDGDLDLFLATKFPGTLVLYRRDGGSFTDATAASGLPPMPDIKQILLVDLNDDGYRELLVTAWGAPVRLFENTAGLFSERANAGGLGRAIGPEFPGLATGASCADIDRDGDLDVYISYWKIGAVGAEARNALYRNDGFLLFTDISQASGTDSQKKSYQPLLSDLTGDGWVDLLLAQDKGGGLDFWKNDGAGNFVVATQESGLVGIESNTMNTIDGMGIACGDYDGDLLPDVYVTSIETGNVLYRAVSPGVYEEVAIASGTLMLRAGWGTTFLDADNDGWLDLYVGNFSPRPDALYHNERDGRFVDVAAAAGVAKLRSTLGLAAGDLDRDGDLDVVTSYNAADSEIFINESPDLGHWIQFELEGRLCNRDAVGAVVTIQAGQEAQRREKRAGISYLSMDEGRLHFGLGDALSCDSVEILWPNGRRDSFGELPADRCYRAVEGEPIRSCDQAPPGAEGTLRIQPSGANPVRLGAHDLVEFRVAGLPATVSAPAVLFVFDGRGRLLRTVRFTQLDASRPTLTWDGSGGDGRRLPSGVYRLRLDVGDRSATTSIALLR
jgi:hypothetical protein